MGPDRAHRSHGRIYAQPSRRRGRSISASGTAPPTTHTPGWLLLLPTGSLRITCTGSSGSGGSGRTDQVTSRDTTNGHSKGSAERVVVVHRKVNGHSAELHRALRPRLSGRPRVRPHRRTAACCVVMAPAPSPAAAISASSFGCCSRYNDHVVTPAVEERLSEERLLLRTRRG